ncbi:MAG TPA: alkaline phosphatase family protein [Candidatus Binataceae bacterium]|nr:alkaline phosphatase family protein [Candidatus Binataceae bacterium]
MIWTAAKFAGSGGFLRGSLVAAIALLIAGCGGSSTSSPSASCAQPAVCTGPGCDINRVKHVIVLMQENESFDKYFGALPYAPRMWPATSTGKGPYHAPAEDGGPCAADDHRCVDGLTCGAVSGGELACSNGNPLLSYTPAPATSEATPTACPTGLPHPSASPTSTPAALFVPVHHQTVLCDQTDLVHDWTPEHMQVNLYNPNASLTGTMDGFATVSTQTYPYNPPSALDALGYYTQQELPFYYALAQNFAVDDRYFSSVVGPTMPNRMYSMAATSFGHVVTDPEIDICGPVVYQPLTGTIFDLLDEAGITWSEYHDNPNDEYVNEFRCPPGPGCSQPGSFGEIFQGDCSFIAIASGQCEKQALPQVSFIELGEDEHPPEDVRDGEYQVSRVIKAVMAGPYWKDSVIFLTYDENGGSYDHVVPPPATPPDAICPGQCNDQNGGIYCTAIQNGKGSSTSPYDGSLQSAELLWEYAQPGQSRAGFDQYGLRVPFTVISPFAKHGYISHGVADHTSMLAFIEKRFLKGRSLTARDAAAYTLDDLFDFARSPSFCSRELVNFSVPSPSAQDCPGAATPTPTSTASSAPYCPLPTPPAPYPTP